MSLGIMGPIRNMFQARKHGPLWKKCKFDQCWLLTIFEKLQAKASDLVSRKNVEYLVVEAAGETRELRLDKITSFSHPEIGTVVVSESWLTFAGCDVWCVLSGFHLTKRFLPDKTYAILTFSHTFLRHK